MPPPTFYTTWIPIMRISIRARTLTSMFAAVGLSAMTFGQTKRNFSVVILCPSKLSRFRSISWMTRNRETAPLVAPGSPLTTRIFAKLRPPTTHAWTRQRLKRKVPKPLQNTLDKVAELFPVEKGKENSLTETLLYLGDIGVEALVSLEISVRYLPTTSLVALVANSS